MYRKERISSQEGISKDEAIDTLKNLTTFGMQLHIEFVSDNMAVLDSVALGKQKSVMCDKLLQIEAQVQENTSYIIEYWLGIGWRNFAAWFIRGEERSMYLLKSLEHLERAFKLSEGYLFSWAEIPGKDSGRLIKILVEKFGNDWIETPKVEKIEESKTIKVSTGKKTISLILNDEGTEVILEIDGSGRDKFVAEMQNDELNIYSEGKIPLNGGFVSEKVNRITIAGSIGMLLVNEAIVRDLEKGLSYLEIVFKNTTKYEPVLCSYAEGFYKLKDYDKAAEVGIDLLGRIRQDKEMQSIIPPAVLQIIAKAYRSKAKEDKRNCNIDQAVFSLKKLIDMDIATENDKKMLKRLQK